MHLCPLIPTYHNTGETPAHTMRTLLSVIQQDHRGKDGGEGLPFVGNFVDVGSGNGAATVAAAIAGQFQTAKGVEYDTSRYQESLLLLNAYEQNNTSSSTRPSTGTPVEFHLGDIGQYGEELLKDASFVF